MPNRDYAARSRHTGRGTNKIFILVIIILILLSAGLALWGLKATSPVQPITPTKVNAPKNTLPSPPEEIYSYIRDLENREVPLDKNSKLARLTKEQEQLLQQQKEEEKRKQALFEQQAQANTTVVAETPNVTPTTVELAKPKVTEEKRQAELKKQQDIAKREAEQKAQEAKTKSEQENTKAKAQEATKVVTKFGLQCGAFKNRASAENIQARLVMAGHNARIVSSGEWNRIVVGPIGDRAAASRALTNAKSAAECVIVGM